MNDRYSIELDLSVDKHPTASSHVCIPFYNLCNCHLLSVFAKKIWRSELHRLAERKMYECLRIRATRSFLIALGISKPSPRKRGASWAHQKVIVSASKMKYYWQTCFGNHGAELSWVWLYLSHPGPELRLNGFTACCLVFDDDWNLTFYKRSSVREPFQAFILLETLHDDKELAAPHRALFVNLWNSFARCMLWKVNSTK